MSSVTEDRHGRESPGSDPIFLRKHISKCLENVRTMLCLFVTHSLSLMRQGTCDINVPWLGN